jgi:hypothetical protein
MELLLNLAWLLLALPAYWLWRGSRGMRDGHRFASAQCLLALGCMLVILFPVISATDDLRAMRTEMEESPSSKQSMRQASGDKPSSLHLPNQPALVSGSVSLVATDETWHQLPTQRFSLSVGSAIQRTGRAPPFSVLG